jgi:hypothetical protein
LAALAAAAFVATAVRADVADASCTGVYSETVAPVHGRPLPPLAIGDSTLILSLPTLHREGISANARGCRQYVEGIALLRAMNHHGTLPRVVVVALGANGPVTERNVTAALSALGATRDLVMVTHFEPGGVAAPDTALIRREPRRHPGRVTVLDWVAYSHGHRGWFQADGLHLTFPGAAAFGRFLARAVPLTAAPPKPRS